MLVMRRDSAAFPYRGPGRVRDDGHTSLYLPPTKEAPMATIAIAKKHDLSHAKAKEAAQKIADDLAQRFDLNCEWKGDHIEFERAGVSGELHVGKAEVRLDCQLGFLLSM